MADRYHVEIGPPEGRRRSVALSGEIDLAAEPEVWNAIEPVLEEVDSLVVDLSGVEFMDSTGLSLLVRAHRRLAHGGGGLVVHGASEVAARLLDVTGLDRLFVVDGGPGAAGEDGS